MVAGVRQTSATELDPVEIFQAVCADVQFGMLAGQNQARDNAARSQGMRDGGKLYRFGTGADDQPYVGKTQSSP